MIASDLGRYHFDEHGRFYTNYDDIWLPSVSRVLDMRDVPAGLKRYVSRTTQEERDEKTFYTQNRGTLAHFELLSQLDPDLEWTRDEQTSEECLKGERIHEDTGLTGDYDTWCEFKTDMEWIQEAWDLITRIYDIRPETTLDVELYVANTDVGYAGQFDLLSVDPETNDVILRDLKTSKFVYDKNLLQLTAYKHAVPIAVDELQVIRMHPDTETWEVSSSSDWKESQTDLWTEFKALREEFPAPSAETLRELYEEETS